MLYWRPAVNASFFKASHPRIYARHLEEKQNFEYDLTDIIDISKYTQFPCYKVQMQKIMVWGWRRKLFVSLVSKMIKGIKALRDKNCAKELVGDRREVTVDSLERELAFNLVANNALSYLYNTAYSNFFCV